MINNKNIFHELIHYRSIESTRRKQSPLYVRMENMLMKSTDRMFIFLMIVQWLFGIACALILSPKTWEGQNSSIHIHVWAALLGGGIISFFPIFMALAKPGESITRHVIALAQMLMSALLIHLMGGRIEAHFHVFGSLAFLAFYRDWPVLVTATIVVALDHYLRGAYWPESVYGVAYASNWRWLEHTGWVIFEDVFIIHSCIQGKNQLWEISQRQENLEEINAAIESKIESRTAELRKTQALLLQSQKMEAIGKLASGIAHDFNNILTGILAYASLLKEEFKKDPATAEKLELIESSAERGAELTKKLLGFARKGQYEKKVIHLNQSIIEVENLLKHTLKKTIVVKMSLDPALWPIEGDSSQMLQILLNLSVNANDAMIKEGELLIESANVEINQPLITTFSAIPPGKYVRISVADTGTGIPPEIMNKMFEPFFTTKEQGKGTGLGLAMVYGIIQEHQGYATVSSVVSQGSRFEIYLPAILDQARESESSIQNADTVEFFSPHAFSGFTLLVVEDEAPIRNFLQHFLTDHGAKVITASDGEEAIQVYAARANEIHLILMDVIMPTMNGINAFYEMQKIKKNPPVIFLSGFAEGKQIANIRGKEKVGFIQKPFKNQELLKEIHRKLYEK